MADALYSSLDKEGLQVIESEFGGKRGLRSVIPPSVVHDESAKGDRLPSEEKFQALKERWNLGVKGFMPLLELVGVLFHVSVLNHTLISIVSRGRRMQETKP